MTLDTCTAVMKYYEHIYSDVEAHMHELLYDI